MKKIVFSLLFGVVSNVMNSQDAFVNNEVNDISLSEEITELDDKYNIAPTGINSKLSDIGSTFFMNKYIMYSSRKTGAIGAGRDESTNNPYNALYCMNMDKSGNLSHPYFFASVLDSKGNEGGLAFTPDEKTLYYTKSNEGNSGNYSLYKRIFDETCRCTWIQETLIPFSSENYSIENPAVSPDGKKLYFSSNMPGGFGGYDLYVADINAEGIPVNPVNLGKNINTTSDEKFPYVGGSNKELYFSSNGHPGYGNQDVFVAKIRKDGYSNPLNLGKTINSQADEIAFILATKTKGYFTSDRSGSLGLYDIYRFDLQKTPVSLQGTAHEKVSKIALPNTELTLVDENGKEIQKQVTDEQGNYKFNVEPLEIYSIVAQKEGYNAFELPVTTSPGNSFANVALDQKKAEVTKEAIIIENIYFEYNKASLKKESTLSLNKIYEVLISNPEMKISVNAHTDCRGSEKYNQALSDKRANSAYQYLIKKGIESHRISPKGFGESSSLSKCTENCTEKEYDADRRIEFLIIE
ncbi:OmpA family protein [Flavobacterium amniphilum]|uniref:OmpA family protein n=1 Tax=Flavobacterium amniphilum TaxID=1834035 RepID=UPI002029CFB6|nr:OmpA family protein [Flavobacterium amniphilum]MCL9804812.1 OmpA family protein [Flavobacterium amniphilum]